MNVNSASSNMSCSARFDQLAADFNARHNFASNATWPPNAVSPELPSIAPSPDHNVGTMQFTGCGPGASFQHFSLPWSTGSSAAVVNITQITSDLGSSANARVMISNCNGSEIFNTTETGVFVMRSSELMIYIEREPQSQTPPYCLGAQRLDFIALPLDQYCQSYVGLPECAEVKKINASSPSPAAPAAASSSVSTVKQSVLQTVFSACLMAVAGFTCI